MAYAVQVIAAVWLMESAYLGWNIRKLALAAVLRRFSRANGEYDSY